jgi:hypothetical protein
VADAQVQSSVSSRSSTVRDNLSSCLRLYSSPILGVKSFDVSLDSQTASVITEPSLDYSTVLEKIKKTGKKVNSGEADGQPQAV